MPLVDVAQKGFSKANQYDTYRPSYPAEAAERMLQVLEIEHKTNAKVLEIGAGTGLFTRVLAARHEKYDITAVEPHDEMRKELEKRSLPSVKVVKGTAESMGEFEGEVFDAVVVAQAFHWMANMDALKEIYRVSKATAVLGLIWNIEDYNGPRDWDCEDKWAKVMKDAISSLEDGHARFRDMKWKQVFDDQAKSDPISINFADPLYSLPLGEDTVDYENWVAKDVLWKRIETHSLVANLQLEQLAQMKKMYQEAVDDPETRLDEQGRVAVHGKTYIAWTSRIPEVPIKQ